MVPHGLGYDLFVAVFEDKSAADGKHVAVELFPLNHSATLAVIARRQLASPYEALRVPALRPALVFREHALRALQPRSGLSARSSVADGPHGEGRPALAFVGGA